MKSDGHIKCIVFGCQNRPDAGVFVGVLCRPCHAMLTTGVIVHGETFIHKLRDSLEDEKDDRAAEARDADMRS